MLRPAFLGLLFLAAILAGCAGGGTPGEGETGGTTAAPIAAGNGRLCLVAVDEAIRPVPGANFTVKLSDGGSLSALSDESGRACLDLPPGTYIVEIRHLHQNYQEAQTTADVEADEESVVKVQLVRLFTQEPYHTTEKFEGFIQCGYSVSGVMSSLCLNDYTHFVGPYTCEDCEHILDSRSTNFAVDAGWQTQVYEMTWEPTAQGTSTEMRLIISFFPRDASHAFCSVAGEDPILIRMDLDVECEGNQGGDPSLVPPEGMPNMHLFAATNAPDGQPASATFSQRFTVFINVFYFGKPPEDWSFIAGNGEFPF